MLAIWGTSYLSSCLLFLTAPGLPFQLKYKSPGGELTLIGDAYAFDYRHGRLSLVEPHVLDPNGTEVARVNRLTVSGLAYPLSRIDVRGDRVIGSITRLATGKLDFQSYLPPSQGPPSTLPFAITFNEGVVLVRDLSGKRPFVRQINGSEIDVRGIGERWLASANLDISQTGSARATVQHLPDKGYLVRASTTSLSLASLFEHLKTTPEGHYFGALKQLNVDQLVVKGPAAIFIPTKAPFQVELQLDAVGDGIRYEKYRIDHAVFKGRVSESGAAGKLIARRGALHADFLGSTAWDHGFSVGGQLSATAPSRASLPSYLSQYIPASIVFSGGRLKGWLSYGAKSGFGLDSRFIGSSATAYDQRFEQPDLDLYVDQSRVRIGINKAVWAGTPVEGAAQIGLKGNQLVGEFKAANANLSTLARRFGANGLTGQADASILVGGTTTKPTILAQASGTAGYPVNGKKITANFRAAANLVNDELDLQRATARTDAGYFRAVGKIYLKGSKLHLKLEGNGVNLAMLQDKLAGTVSGSGVLDGTFSDPRFHGRAIALGVKVAEQDIPFASARLEASRNAITANDVRIVKGSGEATGDIAYSLRDQGLSGQFAVRNLLLNEYFGEDALGAVNIPDLTVGGTLDHPVAAGDAFGENLLLAGIQVDTARIKSSLDGSVARIDEATVQIGDGEITVSGDYDTAAEAGAFSLQANNLTIQRLLPPGKGAANVDGGVSGSAEVKIAPNSRITASATGNLRDVLVNKTDFGSGNWKLAYDGSIVSGEASVGKLDRFFLLENLSYATSSKVLDAQLSVLNGNISDLYTAAQPFIPTLTPETKDLLDDIQGDIDTTVAVHGAISDPDVNLKLLEARDLALKNKPLGNLQTNGTKLGDIFTIDALQWTGPQGDLSLGRPATVDLNGDLSIDAELKRFNLEYLSLISPSVANLKGQADVSLLATGPTSRPSIRASASTSENSTLGIENSTESFKVILDTITVDPSQIFANNDYTGGIIANGKFYYRGFTGDIAAKLPFRYPFEIPDGPPIEATVSIPNVSLNDVAQYASLLDKDRSEGNASGSISLVGPLSNLALRGSLRAVAPTLAFGGVSTTFNQTIASVDLAGSDVNLLFSAEGSDGGQAKANLLARVPDLRQLIDKGLQGGIDLLEEVPVKGNISTDHLAVNVQGSKKEYGNYHATVTSSIDVAGPAREPLLAGEVRVSDTNVLLPSVFAQGGPTTELLFNPRFQIPVVLDGIAEFSTGLADVDLTGDGLLSGSLARPSFDATLNVEKGQLKLPTARVTLEEGGTIRPSYTVSSSGETLTSVDVDLIGHTAVTANRYGDTITRYNIDLNITGDLLKEGGLVLNATSDPPDLSQDEILGLLGQTDVLKSFESGTSQSETERRIREALVSFAVPQLTGQFTSQIAKGLGLDYLNLEYNAFEGASAAFAKSLGKGLIFEGRRQLSPPVGDRKVQYDLRLSYRLPTRNRTLSRLVFSVGLDQDRPYKFGVQYGFRF